MTPSRKRTELARLSNLTIADLNELAELARAAAEQKATRPTEEDLARESVGNEALIADVLERQVFRHSVQEVRRIYCSARRCHRCPHGPFRFKITSNKKTGEVVESYIIGPGDAEEAVPPNEK